MLQFPLHAPSGPGGHCRGLFVHLGEHSMRMQEKREFSWGRPTAPVSGIAYYSLTVL